MAGRDYIRCDDCGCKIVYDGDQSGRVRMEEIWGDPSAECWTVKILCPKCVIELRARVVALAEKEP